jgi:triacylglycerol lipase
MAAHVLILIALLVVLLVSAAVALHLVANRRLPRPEVELRPGERAIVLVHGFLGFQHVDLFGRRHDYFRNVVVHLRAAGHAVHCVRLPPLGSVPHRAEQLARFVEQLPCDKVYLIAHSMGGLDARYAICHLGLAARVAALVTIGTPHRGTPVADLSQTRVAMVARRLLHGIGLRTDALDWLTTARAQQFNVEVPDTPGVLYCSVVAQPPSPRHLCHPALRLSHRFLHRRAGANDGLVPVDSQHWGETLARIDADHWAQIGWSRSFAAAQFYEGIISSLKERGL